jgi:hypothetical protein
MTCFLKSLERRDIRLIVMQVNNEPYVNQNEHFPMNITRIYNTARDNMHVFKMIRNVFNDQRMNI